jgi:hypothetical protein
LPTDARSFSVRGVSAWRAPVPDKIGFFSTGLLIKSDLPEVPSRIRFSGSRMKKMVKLVHARQAAFLAAQKPTK